LSLPPCVWSIAIRMRALVVDDVEDKSSRVVIGSHGIARARGGGTELL